MIKSNVMQDCSEEEKYFSSHHLFNFSKSKALVIKQLTSVKTPDYLSI